MSVHGNVHQELDGSGMVPDRPFQMIWILFEITFQQVKKSIIFVAVKNKLYNMDKADLIDIIRKVCRIRNDIKIDMTVKGEHSFF